ncbi:CaiB/BaiF CoA-transferase family protein [Halobacillus sp. Marseille-Q1614]|uniref:CaiB/BaiF CoA transferase family protein n=1 Tax=Halobacillus sp. Marseille-Q1614 TaxID=2709134 RepID=UPI00156F221A|nr:CaiB/BaiF CoA-transferase family protein [Halobacillus sp. Marseille-Q1614]
MANEEERLPLENLRVIELGTLLAGPFSGRLLADFGAEVIKVEPPGKADPMRKWGKEVNGTGLWWPIQSRNKKSITINLREEDGQNLLKELIKEADVLIENFRPGTMEKWNLSYEELSEINPRLIMVRTSGFGQTGPYKQRAGFGSVGEAMGGLRYVTGYTDRAPTRIGISIGDTLAAMFATIGCLVAVNERSISGKGQVVDTALYESVFSVMESLIPDYMLADFVRERMGNILPGVAPSNIYLTKDETYIVIGANADGVFRRLSEAMGQEELADDPDYATHEARGRNMKKLDLLIEEWTKTMTSRDALSLLEEKGVPSGLIYSAKDMVEDPHYKEREMIVNVDHPELGDFPMPGVVPKLSRTPGKIKHPGSTGMGEHNEAIFKEILKYSDEQLEALKANGII